MARNLWLSQYVVFSKKTKIFLLWCTWKKKRFILPPKINKGSTTKCIRFSLANMEHSGLPPANHLSSYFSRCLSALLDQDRSAQYLAVSSSKGDHLYTEYFITFSSIKHSTSSSTDFSNAFEETVKKISDSNRENWGFFEKINQAAESGPTAI